MKKIAILIIVLIINSFAEKPFNCYTHDIGYGYDTFYICFYHIDDHRLHNNKVDDTKVGVETQQLLNSNTWDNGHSTKDYWYVCPIGDYTDKDKIIRIKLYRSNGTLRFNGKAWGNGCKEQPIHTIDVTKIISYEGYCITRNGNEGKYVTDPAKCK